MKIVALTVCCVDFYPHEGKGYLGGNSLNYAAQARLSAPDDDVSIVTAIGTDEHGKRIKRFFENNFISTGHLYEIEGITASNEIINDEKGERFGVPGRWNNGVYGSFLLSEDDWSYVLDHDIISMPGNNPNFENLLKFKKNGAFIVSDFLDVLNNVPIEKYIEHTDIAFITAGEKQLKYFQSLSEEKNKLLVISMGASGSYAFFRKQVYRQEAIVVPKIVDTTGCGDSYLSAFSIEYYKSGNIKKAMEAGAIAASFTLQHFGGVGE